MLYHTGITQPASEGLQIRLTGQTSHAAEPEKGNSPVHAIASIALYAEGLAEYGQDSLLLCTITGMQCGTGDFGISPGDGMIQMTLRLDAELKMKELKNHILEYANALAREEGIAVSIFFSHPVSHPIFSVLFSPGFCSFRKKRVFLTICHVIAYITALLSSYNSCGAIS